MAFFYGKSYGISRSLFPVWFNISALNIPEEITYDMGIVYTIPFMEMEQCIRRTTIPTGAKWIRVFRFYVTF